jgi:hypothetical protein
LCCWKKLHCGYHTVPPLTRELDEKSAIEIVRHVRKRAQRLERVVEPREFRIRQPAGGTHHTARPHECKVVIAGNRTPHGALSRGVREPREPPLIRPSVRVAHHELDQPRGEILRSIDAILRRLVKTFHELVSSNQLRRPRESRRVIRTLLRILLELTQHSREHLAVLAQPRIIGHHDERRPRMQQTHCLVQRTHHQTARRKQCADLVLHHIANERVAQRDRKRLTMQELVDRTEDVQTAVRSLEMQRLALPPTRVLRRQAARERAKVQHRDPDGRHPQIPPVVSTQYAHNSARVVLRARSRRYDALRFSRQHIRHQHRGCNPKLCRISSVRHNDRLTLLVVSRSRHPDHVEFPRRRTP